MKKRKLPWKFFIANTRKKLWRDNYQRMNSIRIRATDRAKELKDQKHRNLINLVRQWPAEIKSDELISLIEALNYTDKKGKRMLSLSLINRLRRKGLVKYDAGLGIWINLTYTNLTSLE